MYYRDEYYNALKDPIYYEAHKRRLIEIIEHKADGETFVLNIMKRRAESDYKSAVEFIARYREDLEWIAQDVADGYETEEEAKRDIALTRMALKQAIARKIRAREILQAIDD